MPNAYALCCDVRACVLYRRADDILVVPAPCVSKAKELLGDKDTAAFDADASHYVAIWARAQRRRRQIPETGRWA